MTPGLAMRFVHAKWRRRCFVRRCSFGGMELATKQWTQSEKQSDLCLGRFSNGVDGDGVKYNHAHTGLKKAR